MSVAGKHVWTSGLAAAAGLTVLVGACKDKELPRESPEASASADASPSARPSTSAHHDPSDASLESVGAELNALPLPDWPGWPLPAGTKVSPSLFCEGTIGSRLFTHDPKCTAQEVASVHGGFVDGMVRAFTLGCVNRLTAAVNSGRVKIDEKAARTCLSEHVEELTRHDADPAIEKKSCDDAIDGTVASGGACRQPWECATGLACVGYSKNVDGKCANLPALGEGCGDTSGNFVVAIDLGDHPECARGARCSFHKCVAVKNAGDDCMTDSECGAGLGCRAAKCGKPDKLPAGAACGQEKDCGAHLYCADAPHAFPPKKLGTCTPEKKAGEACPDDDACRGLCHVATDAGVDGGGGRCVSFCGSG